MLSIFIMAFYLSVPSPRPPILIFLTVIPRAFLHGYLLVLAKNGRVWAHPRPSESESLGERQTICIFKDAPPRFCSTLRFETHSLVSTWLLYEGCPHDPFTSSPNPLPPYHSPRSLRQRRPRGHVPWTFSRVLQQPSNSPPPPREPVHLQSQVHTCSLPI